MLTGHIFIIDNHISSAPIMQFIFNYSAKGIRIVSSASKGFFCPRWSDFNIVFLQKRKLKFPSYHIGTMNKIVSFIQAISFYPSHTGNIPH